MCGTSYLERCLCFWLAPACQNTTYSCCYSAAHAFIFILYLLWTLCVPVAHLFCHALRGLDGILGWYSYTWAIILQKYILYFPWMSLRSSVSVGQRIKDDVLPLWLLSLGIIFMDKSLWDNIVKVILPLLDSLQSYRGRGVSDKGLSICNFHDFIIVQPFMVYIYTFSFTCQLHKTTTACNMCHFVFIYSCTLIWESVDCMSPVFHWGFCQTEHYFYTF